MKTLHVVVEICLQIHEFRLLIKIVLCHNSLLWNSLFIHFFLHISIHNKTLIVHFLLSLLSMLICNNILWKLINFFLHKIYCLYRSRFSIKKYSFSFQLQILEYMSYLTHFNVEEYNCNDKCVLTCSKTWVKCSNYKNIRESIFSFNYHLVKNLVF